MMLRLELFPECGVVIELAVVTNPNRAVFVGHRLGAAGDVNDRKPAMPERHRPITVNPIAVRPPVRQRGRHTLHDSAISFQAGTVHESSYTAHLVLLSVVRAQWSVVGSPDAAPESQGHRPKIPRCPSCLFSLHSSVYEVRFTSHKPRPDGNSPLTTDH
jgi:hypothetical protein